MYYSVQYLYLYKQDNMAGRPKQFNEIEIIDKAIDVFWSKGYEAASADELLKAMNIGKGSFYLAFPGGKRELFEKSLTRFSDRSASVFNENLQKATSTVEFIKTFFLTLPTLPLERKLKGCYLGNAVIEMAGIDQELKDNASNLLEKLRVSFTLIIKNAQKTGLLKTKQPAELLSLHLINLWNGINLTQRQYPDNKKIKDIINMNLAFLE